MIAALIIVFREVIEAGLVVGIVLAATRGVPSRGLWVSYGVGGGVAGACLVAVFAGAIANAFAGSGQELFNAVILLAAVVMLAWHNVWMARHGHEIAVSLKAVGKAVAAGSRTMAALAIVVGIAVLREGSEVVLFIYGIAVSSNETAIAMTTGGVIGVLLGAGMSAMTYIGLLHIPARHLFSVTGWLIALLAAGMAAQAVGFLQLAGVVTAYAQTLWDTSNFLADNSVLGKILHTLIGYTDRPTALQLLVYLGTLTMIFVLMRLLGSAPRRPAIA